MMCKKINMGLFKPSQEVWKLVVAANYYYYCYYY